MKYATKKATEGTPYRLPIYKNVEARGSVEPTCAHDPEDGCWVCLTCKEFFPDDRLDAHRYKKPKRGDAHVLAWWCNRHQEPEVAWK